MAQAKPVRIESATLEATLVYPVDQIAFKMPRPYQCEHQRGIDQELTDRTDQHGSVQNAETDP